MCKAIFPDVIGKTADKMNRSCRFAYQSLEFILLPIAAHIKKMFIFLRPAFEKMRF